MLLVSGASTVLDYVYKHVNVKERILLITEYLKNFADRYLGLTSGSRDLIEYGEPYPNISYQRQEASYLETQRNYEYNP